MDIDERIDKYMDEAAYYPEDNVDFGKMMKNIEQDLSDMSDLVKKHEKKNKIKKQLNKIKEILYSVAVEIDSKRY
jgi:hypothetical protein